AVSHGVPPRLAHSVPGRRTPDRPGRYARFRFGAIHRSADVLYIPSVFVSDVSLRSLEGRLTPHVVENVLHHLALLLAPVHSGAVPWRVVSQPHITQPPPTHLILRC